MYQFDFECVLTLSELPLPKHAHFRRQNDTKPL